MRLGVYGSQMLPGVYGGSNAFSKMNFSKMYFSKMHFFQNVFFLNVFSNRDLSNHQIFQLTLKILGVEG